TRSKNLELAPDDVPGLLSNGSAWAHIYITKKGKSPNPKDPTFKESSVSHIKTKLNLHRRNSKKKNVHYLINKPTPAA
ncbi:unnamed protein product, partial [Choristocarpus tenellus]